MPTSKQIRLRSFYQPGIALALEKITYTLCFITLFIALIDNGLSIKLYVITTALGVLAIIFRGKPENFELRQWFLPVATLLLGAIDIIWYVIYKHADSPFRSTYSSYLNSAKIFIFGAFLIYLALSSKIRIVKDIPLYVIYSLSFLMAGYAFYIKEFVRLDRVDFGIGTATGAAYSIMLIGLVSAMSSLYTKRTHILLFILNIVAVFFALVLTQTRSTLLLFPIICATILVACYIKKPKKLFFSAVGFIFTIIVMIGFFSKPIYERYREGVTDISSYQNNDSNTSLGARLAMYEIGFDILKEAPLSFRSVESRDRRMHEIVDQRGYLAGALIFSNVHLHNELIEAASLKGIAGIFLTLLFYFSLLYTTYQYRQLGLFALTLAIIGVGLSDVILWARSIPIIIITALILLILMRKKTIS